MRSGFADITKRSISLVIILLLTVVYCGSISNFDAFDSDGNLRGTGTTISQSLLVSFPAASREENGRNAGHEQDCGISGISVAHSIISRLTRRGLLFPGYTSVSAPELHLKFYFSNVCVSNLAYRFLLTNIFFIHLKDGCK